MRVILLGDSLFARHEGLNEPRINHVLHERFPDLEIANQSICGINSGAMLALMGDLVFKQPRADQLFIMVGVNDAAQHKLVPLDQYRRNIESIVSAVVCFYPKTRTVLVSGPAVDEEKQRVRRNAELAKYAKVLEETAKKYQCAYADFFEAMMRQGGLSQLCRGELNDGLHFGGAGYELLGKKLAEWLPEKGLKR